MNNIINKDFLRQSSRAIRDTFGDEFIRAKSLCVCRNIENTAEFQGADTVLLYYPVKNEISPLPLLEVALKLGKSIAFPVCESNGALTFKKISSLDELSPAKFGLLEPPSSAPTIKADKNTLCIVPALAFSRDGARLGYGKGFYDRFLKDFNGVCVGLCYSRLIIDTIPSEAHDQKVDIIITESEVLRIAKKD